MSIFATPDASFNDASDTDVLAGSQGDQGALFDLDGIVTSLLDGVGGSSKVSRISGDASFAIGWGPSGAESLLWDLSAGPGAVLAETSGGVDVQLADINNDGSAVGQVRPNPIQLAAIWERDNGSWQSPRLLGELDGHDESWARGINNAGYVVGRSHKAFQDHHAVLWVPNGGSFDIIDLTPGHTGSGTVDTMAEFVAELAADGTVQVAGFQAIAGVVRSTVWTVHVDDRTVVATRRALEARGGAEDMDADANVLLGHSVWNPSDDVVHELPASGNGCSVGGRAFDSFGNIYGWAEVSTKKSSNCRSDVIRVPVVWTKSGN